MIYRGLVEVSHSALHSYTLSLLTFALQAIEIVGGLSANSVGAVTRTRAYRVHHSAHASLKETLGRTASPAGFASRQCRCTYHCSPQCTGSRVGVSVVRTWHSSVGARAHTTTTIWGSDSFLPRRAPLELHAPLYSTLTIL